MAGATGSEGVDGDGMSEASGSRGVDGAGVPKALWPK